MKKRSFYNNQENASSYHCAVGIILKQLFPGCTLLQEMTLGQKQVTDYRAAYYHVDWFVKELNLAVEVDGEFHYDPIAFSDDYEKALSQYCHRAYLDLTKNRIIQELGWHLVRIPYWIVDNPTLVKKTILDVLS